MRLKRNATRSPVAINLLTNLQNGYKTTKLTRNNYCKGQRNCCNMPFTSTSVFYKFRDAFYRRFGGIGHNPLCLARSYIVLNLNDVR